MPRAPALTIADHLILAHVETMAVFQMQCDVVETVARTRGLISESRVMMAVADDLLARRS